MLCFSLLELGELQPVEVVQQPNHLGGLGRVLVHCGSGIFLALPAAFAETQILLHQFREGLETPRASPDGCCGELLDKR